MDWFNTMLASMLTYCPRWMTRPFAQPYVAGESIEDVLGTIENIINQGFSVTVDILGEHVQTVEKSQTVRDKYCRLYEAIENINGFKVGYIGAASSFQKDSILQILQPYS